MKQNIQQGIETLHYGVQQYLVMPLRRHSMARYLFMRLIPVLLLLVVLDIGLTWLVVQRAVLSDLISHDVFGVLLVSQIILIVFFAFTSWYTVRAGSDLIHEIAVEIDKKGKNNLEPLSLSHLPTEVVPIIDHINQLFDRLNTALAAQDRFLGHAAHQLRTPLTTLKLELEMMLQHDLPHDVKQRIERILIISNRMIRVGEQLLSLARSELSVRENFELIHVNDWIVEVGSLWWHIAHQQQVQLILDMPQQEHISIVGNRLLLEELLGNLIDNALKYARATEIVLRIQDNPVRISVEDNGVGIDPIAQELIFDAFYRTGQNGVEGSGLGLQIVREIVNVHGAKCVLRSRPEFNGTQIQIVFTNQS